MTRPGEPHVPESRRADERFSRLAGRPAEPRSFAGSLPGQSSDSGDPAGAWATDTDPGPDEDYARRAGESQDYAQLGLCGSGPCGPAAHERKKREE